MHTTTYRADTAGYDRKSKWRLIVLLAMLVALAAALVYSVLVGSVRIAAKDVWGAIAGALSPNGKAGETPDLVRTIVVSLRLPRSILAVLTGFCLAISGTGMQAVLRNPLAEPYLLGISAGASFGAAFAIVFGSSVFGAAFLGFQLQAIIVSAFVFGLATMLLVYGAAQLRGGGPETLILAGVAISYIFSAGLSLLKYVSGNEQLREVILWLMGGFAGAKWETVTVLLPVIAIGLAIFVKNSWDLNALGAGEETASSLGVDVRKLRRNCAILSSLMASTVVAFSGIIGFIGLVSPHICRMLMGSDHRYLLPGAGLLGAILLLVADTLSRVLIAPTEIPVGIVTSLIGAPFFLYILLRRTKGDAL